MHSKNTRSQASRQQVQAKDEKPIAKKKKPEVAKKAVSKSVEPAKNAKKKETQTQKSKKDERVQQAKAPLYKSGQYVAIIEPYRSKEKFTLCMLIEDLMNEDDSIVGSFYVERGEALTYYYQADHGIQALGFQIVSSVEPTISDQKSASRGRETQRRAHNHMKLTLNKDQHDRLLKLAAKTSQKINEKLQDFEEEASSQKSEESSQPSEESSSSEELGQARKNAETKDQISKRRFVKGTGGGQVRQAVSKSREPRARRIQEEVKSRTKTIQAKKHTGKHDLQFSSSLTMGDENERAFDNLQLRKALSKQDIIDAGSKKKLGEGIKAGQKRLLSSKGMKDRSMSKKRKVEKEVAISIPVQKPPKWKLVYKKNKWNPFIKLIDSDQQMESTKSTFIHDCCARCRTRNVYRAVNTDNVDLLKLCIQSSKLSTINEYWGPEEHATPLEIAVRTNNHKMIQELVLPSSSQLSRESYPQLLINEVDTGKVSDMAYGTKVAQVQMTRGNRQGNNAFLEDAVNYEKQPGNLLASQSFITKMIYQQEVTAETFKQIFKLNNNIEITLQNSFYVIVRAGKKDLAHEVLKKIVELQNFGFSKLHLDVLSDVPLVEKVNKASVTKAAYQNQGITPLHCACINPDPSFLKALLLTEPDMQTMDKDNKKAIHYAAVCSGPEPLKVMMEKEDVNILDIDKMKQNCLHLAAMSGRAANVKAILDKKPQMLAIKDGKRMTAFGYACKYGHLDTIKVFLEFKHQKVLEAKKPDGTNKIEIIAVKKNAGVGNDRLTPLMWAASSGNLELVNFLLENKARIQATDKYKRSALTLAVRNGHTKVATVLLQNGADWDHKDSSDNTPLHYAAAYGWLDCIEMLIAAKEQTEMAKKSVQDMLAAKAALKKAKEEAKKAKEQKERNDLKALVQIEKQQEDEKQEQIKEEGDEKMVIEEMQDKVVEEPIKEEPEEPSGVNAQNIWKVTPINIALLKNHTGCIKRLLMEPGVDINGKDEKGRTFLHLSVIRIDDGSIDFINLLLEKGADPNIQDCDGNTPLHYLARINYNQDVQLHICELLLSYKANSELLNEENQTAFSISMQFKNFRMIDLLKTKLSFNRNPKLFIQFNSNIWREDYQKIIIQICEQDPPTKETMNSIVQDSHSPFTLYLQTALSGHQQFLSNIRAKITKIFQDYQQSTEQQNRYYINQQNNNASVKEMSCELSNEEIMNSQDQRQSNQYGYGFGYGYSNNVVLNPVNQEKVEKLTKSSFKLNLMIPIIKFLRFFIESYKADPTHIIYKIKQQSESSKKEIKQATNLANLLVSNPYQEDLFQFIQTLITDHKISCDFPDLHGRIPILAVLQSRNVDWQIMYDFLVTQTTDVDRADDSNTSAFLQCFINQQYDLGFSLLKQNEHGGVQIDRVNKSDQYALKLVVSRSKVDEARELIEKWGCDANILSFVEKYKIKEGDEEIEKEYHQSLLQMYINIGEKEHKEFTPMLQILSKVNDVNRLDRMGKSPLYNVAFKRLSNTLDNMFVRKNLFENEAILIEAGARVDFIHDKKQGKNILQLIIGNPNYKDKFTLEFFKLFVDQDYYDINHCDLWAKYTYIEKKIPIETKPEEVKKKHKKLDQRTRKYLKLKALEPKFRIETETLVDYLPDQNVLMNYINSISVLSQATVDIVSYLLTKGVNVNHLDKNDKNVFFVFLEAIISRNKFTLPIMKLFIDHGLDINYVHSGENILFKVVSDSIRLNDTSLEIERLLLDNKIDINHLNQKKQNILFHFIQKCRVRGESYLNFVKLFVERGVDLNNIDDSGYHILYPVIRQSKELKDTTLAYETFLVENGLNINHVSEDGRNILHFAINDSDSRADMNSQLEVFLIESGVNCNLIDKQGRTPLHYYFIKIGSQYDSSEIDPIEGVSSICGSPGLLINVQDEYLKTPLHYAAQRGASICATYMISLGAEVEIEDIFGNTPLATSIFFKHFNTAIFLLQKNASHDKLLYPDTPELIERQWREEIKYQLDLKLKEERDEKRAALEEKLALISDVEESDHEMKEGEDDESEDEQPLYIPEEFKEIEVKLPYKFEINRNNAVSQFKQAIRGGHQSLAYLMLVGGFDFAIAMQDAMDEKKFKLLLTILQKNPSDQRIAQFNSDKQNVMHKLAKNAQGCLYDDLIKIFKVFIKRNVCPISPDCHNKTPLHYAVINQHLDLTQMLIPHYKGIPQIQDNEGMTALHYACKLNNYNIVKALVDEGLYANTPQLQDKQLRTPLHWATDKQNLQLIQLIIPLYDQETAIHNNDKGRSVLHLAAILNNIELLTYFLQLPYRFGVYQAENLEGRTILHYAVKNNNDKMVQLVINEWHKYLNYSEANQKLYEQACMLRDIPEKSTALHYAVNTQRFIILYNLMSQIYDCNYLAKNNRKLTALEQAIQINSENNYTDDRINPYVVSLIGPPPLKNSLFPDKSISNKELIVKYLLREDRFYEPLSQDKETQNNLVHQLVLQGNQKYLGIILADNRHLRFNIQHLNKDGLTPIQVHLTHLIRRDQSFKSDTIYNILAKYGARVDYQVNLDEIYPAFWPFEVVNPDLREAYKDSKYQCNLIMQVLRKESMSRQFKIENIKALIEQGARPEEVDSDGRDYIMHCVLSNDFDFIKSVVSHQKKLVNMPPQVVADEETELGEIAKLQVREVFQIMKMKREMPKRKPIKTQQQVLMMPVSDEEQKIDEVDQVDEERFRVLKINLLHQIAKVSFLQEYRRKVQEVRDWKEEQYRIANIKLNREGLDLQGRSAVHMIVSPLKYGSYENADLLQYLADHLYNLNLQDSHGFTPYQYSLEQKSGRLRKIFEKRLNIEQSELIQNSDKDIIHENWPVPEVDCEADSQAYVKLVKSEQIVKSIAKVPVDSTGKFEKTYSVYMDEGKAWDAYMVKVDLKNGLYGDYVFYKMQLLYDSNKDLYVIFTRWGRIGENGANQRTPFPKLDQAKAEYVKIFKEKTGNNFLELNLFQHIPKKYKLVKINYHKPDMQDYLKRLKGEELALSNLDKETYQLFREMTDLSIYGRIISGLGINEPLLPFMQTLVEQFDEANDTLKKIEELIATRDKLASKGIEADFDAVMKVKDEIYDLSSKYYELIPESKYALSIPPPINSLHMLKEKKNVLSQLDELRYTSKILLAAQLKKTKINPVDYVFKALNIKFESLKKNSIEYETLLNQIDSTREENNNHYNNHGYGNISWTVENIYCVEREGEEQRIQTTRHLGNNFLLFHGSQLQNFVGILSQGLRIAPPEAQHTGHMFGRGVYFADMFAKSMQYANRGGQENTLMLICEVVLGKQKEGSYDSNISPSGTFNSVKGVGQRGPDMESAVYLPTGEMIPQLPVKDYRQSNKNYYGGLSYNEYIVYDESQIRIKYLVQLKQRERRTNSKGYPMFMEPKETDYQDELKSGKSENEEMEEEELEEKEHESSSSSSESKSSDENDSSDEDDY